jgi:hypothetical protein
VPLLAGSRAGGRHADDRLPHPRTCPRYDALLVRRAGSSKHRESKLERTELLDRQAHRPQEVSGAQHDPSMLDATRHALDESARRIVPLRHRGEVLEKGLDIHSSITLEILERDLLLLGEQREHGKQAAKPFRSVNCHRPASV